MTDKSGLAARMKRYEEAYRDILPRRTYTMMRLDGRAFGTYLKNSEKPFDRSFVEDMDRVAVALCREIQGVQFAYTQSDEITLLVTDFQTLQSEQPFGGVVPKLLSIPPSLASAVMHEFRRQKSVLFPQFDCRIWTLTDPVEVANSFVWRQRDAVTNSILMLAQHYYKQPQLQGKSTNELQNMLYTDHGVNWNDLEPGLKRGRVVEFRGHWPKDPTGLAHPDDEHSRANWVVMDAPHFAAQPDNWLATVIPKLPSLT